MYENLTTELSITYVLCLTDSVSEFKAKEDFTVKVEIFLGQREVAFSSPSKIC